MAPVPTSWRDLGPGLVLTRLGLSQVTRAEAQATTATQAPTRDLDVSSGGRTGQSR